MSTTNIDIDEKEAEAAVAEFLEVRAAILGRLSPEALRCVAAIFERRMDAGSEEGSEQTVTIDKSHRSNKEESEREVADAIRGVVALRKLAKETHFQTGRSQSAILKTLKEEQLAKVAVALAALEEAGQ